jgi:ribonuclease HII
VKVKKNMDGKDRLKLEKELWGTGYQFVCGTDEVGRGSLFGSVCIAAVIFPSNSTEQELPKARDSKKLTLKQREKLYNEILEKALAVKVVWGSAERIDEINILQATLECMTQAIHEIEPAPDYCLVDGNQLPKNCTIPMQTVIKGDDKSLSIAAASIVAKVSRDRLMVEIVQEHPELEKYGIHKNMGYPATAHRTALTQHGPSPWHRSSFKWKPVDLTGPVPTKLDTGSIPVDDALEPTTVPNSQTSPVTGSADQPIVHYGTNLDFIC